MGNRLVGNHKRLIFSALQIGHLCLLLLFLARPAAASGFRHLSAEDGLRNPIVRAISQSQDGYVWLGTLKGLYRFDGYALKHMPMPNGQVFSAIKSLQNDDQGHLWITTANSGVYVYHNGVIKPVEWPSSSDDNHFQIHLVNGSENYFLFKHSIHKMNGLTTVASWKNPVAEDVFSGVVTSPDQLMVGVKDRVLSVKLESQQVDQVTINSNTNNRRQHVLHRDPMGVIWLGRMDGVYQYDSPCECFMKRPDVLDGIEVYQMTSDADSLWVGTIAEGLIQYRFHDGQTRQFKQNNLLKGGLIDNSIISLHASNDHMLWLGTFNQGANFIDLNTLKWGATPSVAYPWTCLIGHVVFDIFEVSEEQLWLGTNKGLVQLDMALGACQTYDTHSGENQALSGASVYSISQLGGDLWLTGLGGVDVLNLTTMEIRPWSDLVVKTGTFFVLPHGAGRILVGSNQGLYSLQADGSDFQRHQTADGAAVSALFYQYQQTPQGLYFGTSKGLYKLQDGVLESVTIEVEAGTAIQDISGMAYDPDHGLLIAADKKHLLLLNHQSEIENLSHLLNEDQFNVTAYEMLQDASGYFWVSTDNGIYRLSLSDQTAHQFKSTDGLQSNDFLRISSHQGQSGKIYFGGRQGFNAFYPADIQLNESPPEVVLTAVTQLGKPIEVGGKTLGGWLLDQPINYQPLIELDHHDLAIGFEFAALDYADSTRNRYAYRLLGFNDDWSYVGANDRKVSYTNLDPGQYTFQVKAANKDGFWSPEPKALAIRVYPAPWLSPWAYAAYVLIMLASIWGYIRYRTLASHKRAAELEVTVAERTQEVVQQKRMVESLLDHKNEVFANVTHEFKTPLAMILGPVDEMAAEPELKPFAKQLDMVQRNAKRLLLMVGQILKLSQAEQDKEVIREPQAVQPILLMLFESFAPLARDKGVDLTLDNRHDVNIYATAECLETVVGNLLSNAVKYTPKGGAIHLSSAVNGDEVTVQVTDNGPGIKTADQSKVFNRFTRLDDHKTIQGTGIGLSVVKEVTEANKGHVRLVSELGEGAQFSVTFPISQMAVDGTLSRAATDQLVSQAASELAVLATHHEPDTVEHANTVLIIEDNLDMQQHTAQVLRGRFNCLFADRGEQGIAVALQEVPDIIICDVMMPGMDGYQVTRILRHDERTSHIPIILLTALNTKESRIKGWREKIDRYMTKPFDGTELIVQLESMLSIRQLLQEKTNQVMAEQGSLDTLELPKQDLKFIEKLQDVIAQLYANEYIQRADLADKMAISERQLHRKVKALIGMGPMDMLRDHRLEQAKLKLKDGYQVGLVSDECGFSSVSYFGTCFKKKYGMTPKQYQQLK